MDYFLSLGDEGPEGTRISPPIALELTKIEDSLIEWEADTDYPRTSVEIYVAISDGGDTPPVTGWEQATNGQPLPGIPPTPDISGKFLWCKQVLKSDKPLIYSPYFSA